MCLKTAGNGAGYCSQPRSLIPAGFFTAASLCETLNTRAARWAAAGWWPAPHLET